MVAEAPAFGLHTPARHLDANLENLPSKHYESAVGRYLLTTFILCKTILTNTQADCRQPVLANLCHRARRVDRGRAESNSSIPLSRVSVRNIGSRCLMIGVGR